MDFNHPSAFATINPFGGVDYATMNKGITPVFFIEPVIDERESEKQGRTVYREMERCRILVAGDMLTAAVQPVDEALKARFFDQYESWQRKKSGQHIKGMPLSKWPLASMVMVKELEAMNIFSVEDLAAVADSNIQNIPDGRIWRQKAEAWLKSATDGAAVTRYAAENERLREDLAEMKKRLESLEGKKPSYIRGGISKITEASVAGRETRRWSPERRAEMSAKMRARHAERAAAPADIEV